MWYSVYMEQSPKKSWYIMRVASGSEAEAYEMLSPLFPVVVPMMVRTTIIRKMRIIRRVLAPMLSGYVFIRLTSPADVLHRPMKSYGFLRSDTGRMVSITDEQMDDLIELEEGYTAVIPKLSKSVLIEKQAAFMVGQDLQWTSLFGGLVMRILEVLKDAIVVSAPVPSGRLKISRGHYGALEAI